MDERRHPKRQYQHPRGRRATDPILTTRDVANRLGVGTQFVVEEIRSKRLKALVLQRPGIRALYRIAPADLDAYRARYGWTDREQAG